MSAQSQAAELVPQDMQQVNKLLALSSFGLVSGILLTVRMQRNASGIVFLP